MEAREDLPKVSVETEQDWRWVQQDLSSALLACLDIELESHGQSGDKDMLLPHVHQFLKTLFNIARPNLRINGRTMDDPCTDEDDVEPFDEALDRHIWSLSDQRLKWDKEIADRRRSRPRATEKLVTASLAQHHMCDLEGLEGFDASFDVNSQQVSLELQQTLPNAVSVIPRLLQTMKSQRNRADRIASVSTEVKGLKA